MFEHGPVRIVPLERCHLDFVARVRNLVWRQLGDGRMVGPEGQAEWFEALSRDRSRAYYLLKLAGYKGADDGWIGYVRMTQIDSANRSVCVGGDIDPGWQGKGYGSAMIDLVKTFSFDHMNMNRLWLLVLETNARAIHIYQKAGFEREGVQRRAVFRDGAYIDYVMMSLLREERRP